MSSFFQKFVDGINKTDVDARKMLGTIVSVEDFNIDTRSGFKNLTEAEKNYIGGALRQTNEFLRNNNLVSGANIAAFEDFKTPINTINPATNLNHNDIINLVNNVVGHRLANVADKAITINKIATCVAQVLSKHIDGNGSYSMAEHYRVSKTPIADNALNHMVSNEYASTYFGSDAYANAYTVAHEAFGAQTDVVLPDIRLAIVVTMLKFENNLLNRLLHRRSTQSTMITYVQPFSEIFDLDKAASSSAAEREGAHRIPTINLFAHPEPVDTSLSRVKFRKANDPSGEKLHADDWLKPNTECNAFEMALDSNTPNTTHTNHTDLLSDGAKLDKILIKLNNGTIEEEFIFDVKSYSGAAFTRIPNSKDSAERVCVFSEQFQLRANTSTASGAVSQILSVCDTENYLKVKVSFTGKISNKWGTVSSLVAATIDGHNVNGIAIKPEVAALIKPGFSTLVAYSLDVRYSEENMRKSNISVRTHTRTKAFEIPNTRNYIVDYSLTETLMEQVMEEVSRVVNIGQDTRALGIFKDVNDTVYNRMMAENADDSYLEVMNTLGHDYVAGMKVRPRVYFGQIDLADIKRIREGDTTGDIRARCRNVLNKIVADLMAASFYDQNLPRGEKVVFRCLTSFPLLAACLAAPHYHNHLNKGDDVTTDIQGEYRIVLDCGAILEVVTTPFVDWRNKMLMIPYRAGDAESILNYGHNWDLGTVSAQYAPTIDSAAWKRMFTNSRELPYVTNPLAAEITFKGVDEIIKSGNFNGGLGGI